MKCNGFRAFFVLVPIILALSACGGGGGNPSGPSEPSPTSTPPVRVDLRDFTDVMDAKNCGGYIPSPTKMVPMPGYLYGEVRWDGGNRLGVYFFHMTKEPTQASECTFNRTKQGKTCEDLSLAVATVSGNTATIKYHWSSADKDKVGISLCNPYDTPINYQGSLWYIPD